MKNLFFYSQHCKYSLLLIKIIENEHMDNQFKFISIDDNPTIPDQIRKVPTLVVHTSDVPLEGKNAFEWVRVASKINTMVAKSTGLYSNKSNHGRLCHINTVGEAKHPTSSHPRHSPSIDKYIDDTQQEQSLQVDDTLDTDAQLYQLEIMRNKRKQQDYMFHDSKNT